MTTDRDDLIAQVRTIDKAGEAVENHCECGAPYSQHEYWEDKIYDVNGRRCPSATWHRDYRYDAQLTERKRLEAKADTLLSLLDGPRRQEPEPK